MNGYNIVPDKTCGCCNKKIVSINLHYCIPCSQNLSDYDTKPEFKVSLVDYIVNITNPPSQFIAAATFRNEEMPCVTAYNCMSKEEAEARIKQLIREDMQYRLPNCINCNQCINVYDKGWCVNCRESAEDDHNDEMAERQATDYDYQYRLYHGIVP